MQSVLGDSNMSWMLASAVLEGLDMVKWMDQNDKDRRFIS